MYFIENIKTARQRWVKHFGNKVLFDFDDLVAHIKKNFSREATTLMKYIDGIVHLITLEYRRPTSPKIDQVDLVIENVRVFLKNLDRIPNEAKFDGIMVKLKSLAPYIRFSNFKNLLIYKKSSHFDVAVRTLQAVASKKDVVQKGAKKVKLGSNEFIYEITSYEAVCRVGANTKWCVTTKGDDRYWNNYSSENNFYIYIRNGEKFAVLFDKKKKYMDSMWDAQDKYIADRAEEYLSPKAMQFFEKLGYYTWFTEVDGAPINGLQKVSKGSYHQATYGVINLNNGKKVLDCIYKNLDVRAIGEKGRMTFPYIFAGENNTGGYLYVFDATGKRLFDEFKAFQVADRSGPLFLGQKGKNDFGVIDGRTQKILYNGYKNAFFLTYGHLLICNDFKFDRVYITFPKGDAKLIDPAGKVVHPRPLTAVSDQNRQNSVNMAITYSKQVRLYSGTEYMVYSVERREVLSDYVDSYGIEVIQGFSKENYKRGYSEAFNDVVLAIDIPSGSPLAGLYNTDIHEFITDVRYSRAYSVGPHENNLIVLEDQAGDRGRLYKLASDGKSANAIIPRDAVITPLSMFIGLIMIDMDGKIAFLDVRNMEYAIPFSMGIVKVTTLDYIYLKLHHKSGKVGLAVPQDEGSHRGVIVEFPPVYDSITRTNGITTTTKNGVMTYYDSEWNIIE